MTNLHKHGYGYIPDLGDFRDHLLTVHAPITGLPSSVDMTASMPSVYDQGQLGSCTGNAIAGAIQFERMKQSLPGAASDIPSRLFIYYNERVKEHTVNEDAGAQIRDGIKSVAKLGACYESGSGNWPYDPTQFKSKPRPDCYLAAKLDRAVQYARVNQTLSDLKACLAAGHPFVIGFTCYESFESDEVAKTGILNMPARSEKVVGGHAVLVVGYDDASERFRVRNSWGSSWGQTGYFTIPYDYYLNNDLASDIWNIQLVGAGK